MKLSAVCSRCKERFGAHAAWGDFCRNKSYNGKNKRWTTTKFKAKGKR